MPPSRAPHPGAGPLWYGPAAKPEHVHQARRLHARKFREAGWVGALPDDGVLNDVWTEHSNYFVAVDGLADRVVGTCRVITHTDEHALPTLKVFGLALRDAELDSPVAAGRAAELSALAVDASGDARREIAAGLYKAMWQRDAVHDLHDLWVFSTNLGLFEVLRDAFGFPVVQIGPAGSYFSYDGLVEAQGILPAALDLRTAPAAMRQSSPEVLAWFEEGLPVSDDAGASR